MSARRGLLLTGLLPLLLADGSKAEVAQPLAQQDAALAEYHDPVDDFRLAVPANWLLYDEDAAGEVHIYTDGQRKISVPLPDQMWSQPDWIRADQLDEDAPTEPREMTFYQSQGSCRVYVTVMPIDEEGAKHATEVYRDMGERWKDLQSPDIDPKFLKVRDVDLTPERLLVEAEMDQTELWLSTFVVGYNGAADRMFAVSAISPLSDGQENLPLLRAVVDSFQPPKNRYA